MKISQKMNNRHFCLTRFLGVAALIIFGFFVNCTPDLSIPSDLPSENEQKCHEYTLNNGIKILLHEDFSMPIVVVSIIFHVGLRDCKVHQCGIPPMIAHNLVNTKLHERFFELGITYFYDSLYGYTFLMAEMHPKHIKNFFDLVSESICGIFIEDFEICKKHLIISNKLNSTDPTWNVSSNITSSIALANGIPNCLPNNGAIDAMTEADVLEFFSEKYKDCPLSIVVSGAVSSKILMKALQSSISKLATRKTLTFWKNDNILAEKSLSRDNSDDFFMENHSLSLIETVIRGRQLPTVVGYCYNIPTNHEDDDSGFADVFSRVLFYEAFLALVKTRVVRVVHELHCKHCQANVMAVYISPKISDSIKDLERNYEHFLFTMCRKKFSREFLAKIADIYRVNRLRMFCDLIEANKQLTTDYTHRKDVQSTYTLEKRIRYADPKSINSFATRHLFQKHILKVKIKTDHH